MASRGRLGRFELVSHLASGGMAKVYLARIDGLAGFERYVVLKTLAAADIPDESYVGMFLDEARLAASLHHQNIAQVYEVGFTDDTYFLAMEYVHGKTLRSLLEAMDTRGRRLPLDFALSVCAAAAAGLHHAHEASSSAGSPLSIVHRDVSPSNVLVGYDGATKLIDFGIAKAEARQTHTKTGFVKGKAGYMAPEQARGYDVDRRSDIFALGILAFELTTQQRAFDAPSEFERVEKIVHGDLTPPSRIIANYPPDLEAALLTALALDPDDRFQTADEFRLAIEQCARTHNITLGTAPVVSLLASLYGAPQAPWVTVPQPSASARARRVARGSVPPSSFLDSIPTSVDHDEDSEGITTPHDLQEPDDFELEIIAGRATPLPQRLTPREPAIRSRQVKNTIDVRGQKPRAGTIKPVDEPRTARAITGTLPAIIADTGQLVVTVPPRVDETPDSDMVDSVSETKNFEPPRVTREVVMERGTSVSELAVEFTKRPASASASRPTSTAYARGESSSGVPTPVGAALSEPPPIPPRTTTRNRPPASVNVPSPTSVPDRPARFARSSSAPPSREVARALGSANMPAVADSVATDARLAAVTAPAASDDAARKTLFGVEPHVAPTRPTPRPSNPGAVPIVPSPHSLVAANTNPFSPNAGVNVLGANVLATTPPGYGSRMLTAQQSRFRMPPLAIVIAIGLALGLGVGLALVLMTEKNHAPAPVTKPPATLPPTTPAPQSSTTKGVIRAQPSSAATFSSIGGEPAQTPTTAPARAPAAAPTTTPPAATTDMVTLTVTSTPKGATVVLDGERLGRTPFTTKIPRAQKASWLKVRMTTYAAQRISVQRADDITWDVSLKKVNKTDDDSAATE